MPVWTCPRCGSDLDPNEDRRDCWNCEEQLPGGFWWDDDDDEEYEWSATHE